MTVSIVKNCEEYLRCLHRVISENAVVSNPKDIHDLVELRKTRKGEIKGWKIDDREIVLSPENELNCDESAIINGDRVMIRKFSYHFNPNEEQLLTYRIDLELGKLHFNPDISLESELGHRISPDQIPVNINNFNCLFAIYLALEYIKRKIYPSKPEAHVYNQVLEGIRRRIRE